MGLHPIDRSLQRKKLTIMALLDQLPFDIRDLRRLRGIDYRWASRTKKNVAEEVARVTLKNSLSTNWIILQSTQPQPP